jgi:hypothetical protein
MAAVEVLLRFWEIIIVVIINNNNNNKASLQT